MSAKKYILFIALMCTWITTLYNRPIFYQEKNEDSAKNAANMFLVALAVHYCGQTILNMLAAANPWLNNPLLALFLFAFETRIAQDYTNRLHREYSDRPYKREHFLAWLLATLLPKPTTMLKSALQQI